jgi:hypothetical protein
MRIEDIIVADEYLEEGPIWDKTRQVGAAVGKGLGAVGQGIGAVAGVPAGIARAIGKGYNRSANTIAGGPDENPQQGSAQYQPAGQQQSAAGQGAEDPATMRKQARDLMARADEVERQQKQTSQSAPSQQTTQSNQDTGNATSGQQASQAQNTGSSQQASQAQPNQTQQAPETPADPVSTTSSTGGQTSQTATGQVHTANPNNPNNTQSTSAKPNADVTDVEPKTKQLPAPTQQKSQRNPNYTDAEMKAHQAAGGTYDDETGKMIPPPQAGGSYNNQIGNGKANYGVTTNFDPKTMKNVSTPLDPKAVGVVPNTTNPTTNNTNQQANLKARLQSKQGIGNKTNSGFKNSGVGKPVQKIVGADKQGNPVVSTVREDIQYYSRFLKVMI